MHLENCLDILFDCYIVLIAVPMVYQSLSALDMFNDIQDDKEGYAVGLTTWFCLGSNSSISSTFP